MLTEEGRQLQELFGRFLWDVSQYQDKVTGKGQLLEGDLRVGLPLNFSKSVFLPLMARFGQEHPRVRFHLVIGESRRLVELLSKFELDFAITDDAIPQEFLPKIVTREVFKEELVLVASTQFLKQHEKALKTLKGQRELPHLDYSRHLPLLSRWYKAHHSRMSKHPQVHTIDNVETMVIALAQGLGLGIIPKSLLQNSAATADLRIVPCQEKALYNALSLVQEMNYINGPLVKKFLQFLAWTP